MPSYLFHAGVLYGARSVNQLDFLLASYLFQAILFGIPPISSWCSYWNRVCSKLIFSVAYPPVRGWCSLRHPTCYITCYDLYGALPDPSGFLWSTVPVPCWCSLKQPVPSWCSLKLTIPSWCSLNILPIPSSCSLKHPSCSKLVFSKASYLFHAGVL